MLRDTLVLEPLAQAADSDATGFAHTGIRILETRLNDRPHLTHQWRHELAASFNGDAEREHGSTTGSWVRRCEVGLDEVAQRWEDLVRRKVGSQAVNDSESRLS